MIFTYIGIFIVIGISLYCIFLGIKKTKDFKEKEETESPNKYRTPICKQVETCWCCHYDLDEDKKEKILREFGIQHCGKSISSIVNDE